MEYTYTLTITGTEHGEWQGRLRPEGEQEEDFHSLLGLIRLMNQALDNELPVNPLSEPEALTGRRKRR